MCIRDRAVCYHKDKLILFHRHNSFVYIFFRLIVQRRCRLVKYDYRCIFETVSYTHLDVYKRQSLTCSFVNVICMLHFSFFEIMVNECCLLYTSKAHGTNMPSVHKRKVYPNELCPCGSGMKYKKCCGKNK